MTVCDLSIRKIFEQILAAKSLQRQESKTLCIQVELSDLLTKWVGYH
jgi:hypothetical protein